MTSVFLKRNVSQPATIPEKCSADLSSQQVNSSLRMYVIWEKITPVADAAAAPAKQINYFQKFLAPGLLSIYKPGAVFCYLIISHKINLFFPQFNNTLNTCSVGEHINRLYFVHPIVTVLFKIVQIPCQSFRIAGNINHCFR